MSVEAFISEVKSWRKKVEKKIDRTLELFVVDFTNHLIGRTPVGDPSLWKDPAPAGYQPGTLINSWFTTLNVPYTGGVRKQSTSGADAIKQASRVAMNATGNIIHIVNPTPYANMIEYEGWSQQAPAGMARITATQFFNTRKLRKVFRNA